MWLLTEAVSIEHYKNDTLLILRITKHTRYSKAKHCLNKLSTLQLSLSLSEPLEDIKPNTLLLQYQILLKQIIQHYNYF